MNFFALAPPGNPAFHTSGLSNSKSEMTRGQTSDTIAGGSNLDPRI